MAIPPSIVGHLCANIILQFIAIMGVLLRCIVRRRTRQSMGSDDYTIIVSLICSMGLFVGFVYGVGSGVYGVPWANIPPSDFVTFRKILFSSILISHFVYGLIKISVVLFYKRIFTSVRSFNIAANTALSAISIFMIVSFFTFLFCARGITSFWTTPATLEGTQYVLYPPTLITTFAALDVALDLCVLSLPLPIIKTLKLSRRRRIGITAVFLLGSFCLVCSVIRLYYTRTLEGFTSQSIEEKQRLSENNDLWAHIEAYASVFTACLPTLRPLFTSESDIRSLISRMRYMFSNRSKSLQSYPEVSNETSSPSGPTPAQRNWYEMSPNSEAQLVSSRYRDGPDGRNPRSDATKTQKSLRSQSEHAGGYDV